MRLRHALERAGESTAFITVTAERALREAGAPGPLRGKLLAWKDVFDVAGTRTTAGSATRRAAPIATEDAPVVRDVAAAGGICLGKTNLSEFAFTGLGLNPHFGDPVNPVDPLRIPGGSSSGSAVAVAAGIADIAIGTDTSGSTRVPAACCGILGFRASANRYDLTGLVPLSPGLDSVGILARTVGDVLAADAAMRGRRATVGTGSLRVVVPDGELVDDCHPDVRAAFHTALSGLEVRCVRLAALEEAQRLLDEHGPLVAADAWRRYGHLRDTPGVDPLVRRRLRPPGGESELRSAQARLRGQLTRELDGAVLAFPTIRDPVPRVAPLRTDLDLAETVNRRILRSTMLASYLGLPGVTLPDGLLVSLPDGHDDRLLAVAGALETRRTSCPTPL
jgi:aspartyl-tRNA(Asn)/glutamyl-tRNA(Gln) amidotransferase subunit A